MLKSAGQEWAGPAHRRTEGVGDLEHWLSEKLKRGTVEVLISL